MKPIAYFFQLILNPEKVLDIIVTVEVNGIIFIRPSFLLPFVETRRLLLFGDHDRKFPLTPFVVGIVPFVGGVT